MTQLKMNSLNLASMTADVRAFHERFGLTVNDEPTQVSTAEHDFRSNLISEEAAEVWAEVVKGKVEIHKLAHELVDLLYVTVGYAVTIGVDLQPVWDAVHAANMAKHPAKIVGEMLMTLKPFKPPGWTPADVWPIIESQIKGGDDDESGT